MLTLAQVSDDLLNKVAIKVAIRPKKNTKIKPEFFRRKKRKG